MPNTNERDALTAALKSELNDDTAAAHIYPSTLKTFQRGEHCGECWSIKVGNEDEESVGVFTVQQVIDALAATAPNAGAPLAAEFDVRTIMLDVTPGIDGMGHEVYAKSVADVEKVLAEQGEKLENWELGILRYKSDAAPAQQAGAPELLCGWTRYEKARKLSPIQWADLHARNLAGEAFDDMIDALPTPSTPTPAGAPLPLAPRRLALGERIEEGDLFPSGDPITWEAVERAFVGELVTDFLNVWRPATPQQALPLAPSEEMVKVALSVDDFDIRTAFDAAIVHRYLNGYPLDIDHLSHILHVLHAAPQATLPASEADEESVRAAFRAADEASPMRDKSRWQIWRDAASWAFATRAQPQADAAEPVARDAQDGPRYRWLRDLSEPGICALYLSVGKAFDGVKFTQSTVDEAIDAQIAAQAPGARGEQA